MDVSAGNKWSKCFVLQYGASDGSHYWLLLAMTVAIALTIIPLPETLGLQLPQTFQDAEELGDGRPFTSWVHHWNLHKFLPPTEPQHEKCNENLLPKPS